MIVDIVSALRAWLHRHPRLAVALTPLALLAAVPGALLVPAALLLARRAPPVPSAPAGALAAPARASAPALATPDMQQLLRALDEAHRNCEAARLATGPRPGLFHTTELETALLENPWVVDRALGEADTLLDEAAWLASLDEAPLRARGRSWEDVRFLLGGIHWYLERAWDAGARSEAALRAHPAFAGDRAGAPMPEPARHPNEAVDRAALRAYADVPGFEDLLGAWD